MSTIKKLNMPWMLFLLVVILAGLYAGINVMMKGHYLFNGNDIIIWTLPLAVYVFFALASTGLSIVAALPSVFGIKAFAPLGKKLVFLAITTLFGAFIAIAIELGSLGHIFSFLTSPNTNSPIWWMGVFYTLELIFLILKFMRYQQGDTDSSASLWMGRLSMMSGISAALTLGAVFGLAESRAASYGAFMPVMFLMAAFVSGVALIVLYEKVRGALGGTTSEAIVGLVSILKVSVGIVLIISVLETIFYGSASTPGMALTGSTVVIILLAIAWILVAFLATDMGSLLSSAVALIAMFVMHMNHMIAPQLTPLGPTGEGVSMVSYTPNITEWMIFALSAAVVLFCYSLGEYKFKLDE